MTTQIVLVPGFWLGAWAWEDVTPLLLEDGFAVTALTLPGLDPDVARDDATLSDHADAIASAIDPSAERRVVVVHSGAAVPGTLLLDRHPDLVDRMVFVDTAPAGDGFAMNDALEGPFDLADAWDDLAEEGSFRDLTDDQLSVFRDRAVPQPNGAVAEPVRLGNPDRLAVPITVICTAFPSEEYKGGAEAGVPFLAGLTEYGSVDYVDLPTGHWPMWSKPAELADLIAAAARE